MHRAPGCRGVSCSVNASAGPLPAALFGSKRKIRAQLDDTRTVKVARPGMSEVRGADARVRIGKVRMIENVQEFTLQAELKAFTEGYDLGKREIVIPQVRSIEPDLRAERARLDVLTNAGDVAIADTRRAG